MAIALPFAEAAVLAGRCDFIIPAVLDVLLHAGYPALDARWQHAAFAGSSGYSARGSLVGSGSGYSVAHDAHARLVPSTLPQHYVPSPPASSVHSVQAREDEAGGRAVNDSVATWGDDEVRGTQVCVYEH